MQFKIFISSVQREFAAERKLLADYIRKDAILCKFFDVFLFGSCKFLVEHYPS